MSTGPSKYIEQKQHEIDTIGFEEGRFQLSTTISANSQLEIVEAFLGLKKVAAENVQSSETRFGIQVPVAAPSGSGMLSIEPKSKDKCRIHFRATIGADPITFDGKVYTVPKGVAPKDALPLLIRTDLFHIMMWIRKGKGADASTDCKLSIDGEKFRNQKFKVDVWRKFYELYAALCGGPMRVEIAFHRAPGNISGTFNVKKGEKDPAYWSYMADIVGGLEHALIKAGASNMKLSIEEIMNNDSEIENMNAMMLSPNLLSSLSFHTDRIPDVEDGFSAPILCYRAFPLGKFFMVYCGKIEVIAKLQPDHIEWCGGESAFVNVVRLANLGEELDRFTDAMAMELKIHNKFLSSSTPVDRPAPV